MEIVVPSLSPSGSWFADGTYVPPDHATEVTVNVTLVVVPGSFVLDT